LFTWSSTMLLNSDGLYFSTQGTESFMKETVSIDQLHVTDAKIFIF